MKFIICVAFAIALIAAVNSSSTFWGSRNGTDYLVLREKVIRSPLKNNYWSVNIEFPKWPQNNTRTITAINVYDHFTNRSGATNSLWSGGPGVWFATVNLKSQNSQGINSTVEIYAK